MPNKIAKAYAISDAKISFVSLVDKAANQKRFLITKSEDGKANFQTYGRIVKTDASSHFVTGIVYEPMVEDSHGNYMTEEEIEKSAHWFMKNGDGADMQHNFEKLEGAEVVESWIAKADYQIDGQDIKKGTWLMTMEITDDGIFDRIEKHEITGFSMGGTGIYSEVDVDITPEDEQVEKGFFKRLAKMFGLDVIEKGAVMDSYKRNSVRDNFYTAFYSLSNCLLDVWNPEKGEYDHVKDEDAIKTALSDFNQIITELLSSVEPVTKMLAEESIEKAGKKMSNKNKETLKSIHESLGAFLSNFDEEEIEVTKSELEGVVSAAVQKALESVQKSAGTQEGAAVGEKPAEGVAGAPAAAQEPTEPITAESIEKMVGVAVQKALAPKEEPLTAESLAAMIDAAVAKAVEPVLKSTRTPTNLNNTIVKSGSEEEHYMSGFFSN